MAWWRLSVRSYWTVAVLAQALASVLIAVFTAEWLVAVIVALLDAYMVLAMLWEPGRTWRKNPDISQPQALEITDAQVLIRARSASATVPWEQFICFRSVVGAHMLAFRSGMVLIPRRAFARAADERSFVELARSRVPTRYPRSTGTDRVYEIAPIFILGGAIVLAAISIR